MKSLRAERGFTLIELMISLFIGLLVSAAAMQIYLTMVKTSSTQLGGSSVIDANIFGFQQMEKSIRLANLGMSETNNPYIPMAGIVLTSEDNRVSNQTDASKNNMNGIKIGGTQNAAGNKGFPAGYLTRGGTQTSSTDTAAWVGSNSNLKNLQSSQLTIQYEAPEDMRDCEGVFVRGPKQIERGEQKQLETVAGQIVVERYFLSKVAAANKADYETDVDSYELRCDAGRYVKEDLNDDELAAQAISGEDSTILKAAKNIRDLGDVGVAIVPRVDYFGTLLGTEITTRVKATGVESITLRYFTPEAYIAYLKATEVAEASASATTETETDILAVKVTALVRAPKPLVGEAGPTAFTIFGSNYELSANTNKGFIRRVYDSNIMLRNARAISVGSQAMP